MAVTDETLAVTVKPLRVPLDAPTEQSLAAEAAALGDAYSEVTAHPADLLAHAAEMLKAKSDAAALAEREYAPCPGVFTRIELVAGALTPMSAQQVRHFEASKVKTAEAERKRLLTISGEIARIGHAARLPTGVFSLETDRPQPLNVVMMKVEEVLLNVAAHWAHLPDKKRLVALVTEARALTDAQKAARHDARLLRTDRSLDSRKAGRCERLLLNAMQNVSARGLAAFPQRSGARARVPAGSRVPRQGEQGRRAGGWQRHRSASPLFDVLGCRVGWRCTVQGGRGRRTPTISMSWAAVASGVSPVWLRHTLPTKSSPLKGSTVTQSFDGREGKVQPASLPARAEPRESVPLVGTSRALMLRVNRHPCATGQHAHLPTPLERVEEARGRSLPLIELTCRPRRTISTAPSCE